MVRGERVWESEMELVVVDFWRRMKKKKMKIMRRII